MSIMKLSVAVGCVMVMIPSISADFSKYYDGGGEISEQYDYYQDDNITGYDNGRDIYEEYEYYEDDDIAGYNEGSDHQTVYREVKEPQVKINPTEENASDELQKYNANSKPLVNNTNNLTIHKERTHGKVGDRKSSNKQHKEEIVNFDNSGINHEEYDTYRNPSQRTKASTSNGKEREKFSPVAGIDFSGREPDPDTGWCCVTKEERMITYQKEKIYECTHKSEEQCHYTFVTQFRASQQELCEETFSKHCSISFSKKAGNETVEKCYKPLVRVCEGEEEDEDQREDSANNIDHPDTEQGKYNGERRKSRFKKDVEVRSKKCTTPFESSCSTRYVEKSPGKFVGETSCEKLPVEFCEEGNQLLHSRCRSY